MKKRSFMIMTVILLFAGFQGFSLDLYTAESGHYRILSDISQDDAVSMTSRMEAYYGFFNRYFRFRDDTMEAKLTVRVFGNKESFDSYLTRLIPQSRDSYVYIQYRDPAKSELVVYRTDGRFSDEMLIHHAFIQFLKGYVPNPPLWILSGFSLYFEKSVYRSEDASVLYKENTAWIKPLKEIVHLETLGDGHGELLSLEQLFTATADDVTVYGTSFYPQAWGWISFFIHSEQKGYSRILWDAISSLRSDAPLETNSGTVYSETVPWYQTDVLKYDFMRYAESLMTFSEMVTTGIVKYKAADYEAARALFQKALSLQSDSPVPYYYLGLISYGEENFTDAEYYYNTSLNAGGERALCLYALGLNSMAAKRFGEAREYLAQAASSDPAKYGSKVQDLLVKLEEQEEM